MMVRLALLVLLFIATLPAASGAASTPKYRSFTCLTGSAFGCLDKVPIVHPTDNTRDLVTDDMATVDEDGIRYFYRFDKDATYAESSPRYIRPDDYGTNGPGVWILSSVDVENANVRTQFKLPSSDADPTSTAGYIRHDSTVTGYANGALRWYDGSAIRTVVDILSTETLTNGYVVTYDATNDRFYLGAAGAGGAVETDAIWDAAGDLAVGTGANTATRLPMGTAHQVLRTNATATALEWTGSLSISGLTLGGIILGDDTPDAAGEFGYSTNAFRFYGNAEDMVITLASNAWTFSSTTGVTDISLSALNLATTGTIDGKIIITESSSSPVTVAGMSGFYTNASDSVKTFNLPADPTGRAYCFANTLYARALTINPDDADYILMSGTAGAAGEAIVSTGAATEMVCLVGINTSYWRVTAKDGTWAQESP